MSTLRPGRLRRPSALLEYGGIIAEGVVGATTGVVEGLTRRPLSQAQEGEDDSFLALAIDFRLLLVSAVRGVREWRPGPSSSWPREQSQIDTG